MGHKIILESFFYNSSRERGATWILMGATSFLPTGCPMGNLIFLGVVKAWYMCCMIWILLQFHNMWLIIVVADSLEPILGQDNYSHHGDISQMSHIIGLQSDTHKMTENKVAQGHSSHLRTIMLITWFDMIWRDLYQIVDVLSGVLSTASSLQYHANTGLILGLHPANERWCYFVMTSHIGWVQT